MRVYNEENEPFDFCLSCSSGWAIHFEDPDACDPYARHPNYAGEDYDCDGCGKRLKSRDNVNAQ